MTKNDLVDKIRKDIDWRYGEIATIKTIIILVAKNKNKKNVAIKYSIPALYSVWEGFIRNCFENYGQYINEKKLSTVSVNLDILVSVIYNIYDLNNARGEFEKRKELISNIHNYFKSTFMFRTNSNFTNSNVDFKTLSLIMKKYAVPIGFREEEKFFLLKFVEYRNKVAHGDSIKTNENVIEEFSQSLIDLMEKIYLAILDAMENETYLLNALS